MKTFALQHGRLNQVIQKTPVAIAATLLTTAALAQVADHTTSADAPEASSAFDTSGQASIGTRPFTSFLQRLASPVESIDVKVAGDNLPADGVGGTDVLVTLKGGQSHAGVIKSESGTELVLNSAEDGLVTVKKSEITGREKGLSGMPEGFGDLLSKQDLRNLVEYLATAE